MKKVIGENVRIIAVALILSLGTSVAFAWTGPTATPPSSNISAPVNIGSTSQIKTGGLWVNSLGTDAGLTVGGKLGIGVTAPTEKLEVNGNVKLSNGTGAYGAGRVQVLSTGDIIGYTLNSGTRVWDLISITSSAVDYFAIRDNTANANRLQIDENGNVGIGTTPTQKLDVNGNIKLSSAGTAGITALTGTNWGYSASYPVVMVGPSSGTGNVSIGYNPSGNTNNAFAGDGREVLFRNGVQFVTPNTANNAFYLNNLVLKDGNVGIGTAAPTTKLDVNGAITVNGTITDPAYRMKLDPAGPSYFMNGLSVEGSVKFFGNTRAYLDGSGVEKDIVAPTDGFVVANLQYGYRPGQGCMWGTVGSMRMDACIDAERTSIGNASFTMPVGKAKTWRIDRSNSISPAWIDVYFIPFGTALSL